MPDYTPVFTSELEPAYSAAYGSSLHRSRVGAAPRAYAGIHRFPAGWVDVNDGYVRKPWTPRSPELRPRFVVVSSRGEHVAVDRGWFVEVHDASGAFLAKHQKTREQYVAAGDGAFYLGGQEYHWDGTSGTSINQPGLGYPELVSRVGPERWTVVVTTRFPTAGHPHGPGPVERPVVYAAGRQLLAGTEGGQAGFLRENVDGVGTSAAISG